jgi:lupus La protein
MWELTDGPENNPVPIEKLHSFKRMQRFQPYSAVVAALKESEILDISGEEGKEVVKRKIPYDPKKKSAGLARSVYVKGFGEEDPKTQFDLEEFFRTFGPVVAVRLRRSAPERVFKGSVFVEFEDEEAAEKFLNLEPKPLWEGKELLIKSKQDYESSKIQDIKDGKTSPNASYSTRGRGGGARPGRSDRDPNDWKKRREDDQKNGFRDDRNDRRGGRGGRGGRGRGNNDRSRDNDRNNERRNKPREDREKRDEEPSKKRAREDDDAGEEAPTKKEKLVKEDAESSKAKNEASVDVKKEVSVEN